MSRCCSHDYKYQAVVTFSYRECSNGGSASPQGCIIELLMTDAFKADVVSSYQVTHHI